MTYNRPELSPEMQQIAREINERSGCGGDYTNPALIKACQAILQTRMRQEAQADRARSDSPDDPSAPGEWGRARNLE
jgi:hypothetical protein